MTISGDVPAGLRRTLHSQVRLSRSTSLARPHKKGTEQFSVDAARATGRVPDIAGLARYMPAAEAKPRMRPASPLPMLALSVSVSVPFLWHWTRAAAFRSQVTRLNLRTLPLRTRNDRERTGRAALHRLQGDLGVPSTAPLGLCTLRGTGSRGLPPPAKRLRPIRASHMVWTVQPSAKVAAMIQSGRLPSFDPAARHLHEGGGSGAAVGGRDHGSSRRPASRADKHDHEGRFCAIVIIQYT